MENYVQALRILFSAIDPGDRVEAVKLLAAIDSMARRLKGELPPLSLVRGELEHFRTSVWSAILPGRDEEPGTPAEWLAKAAAALTKLEQDVRDAEEEKDK